ncbi:MAG: YceI family protein [Chloroflexota bacterium]|nr:YceI family protein [Chloroflexota bacterium]MDE2969345.1 YceI family protein [Chloroflexota bacterium]
MNTGFKRVLALTIFAALLALALAACGGESDDEATTADTVQEPVSAPAAEPTAAPEGVEGPASEPAPTVEPTAAPTEEPAAPRQTGEVDGITFIVGEGSEATFSVGEELRNLPLPIVAVMRTEELSGEVHLDGRESRVSIDLQTLSSDQAFRDRWTRNRLFGQHPTGTFILPDATPLPDGFTNGDTVETQVTGTLELLGQTFPVTFDIQARDDGDVVVILGKTTFTWDDFGIEKPTAPSVVSLEDEVTVNVLISARPG